MMDDRNIYKLIGGDDPIHWSTKFGKNFRVGENVVIEENCTFGDNVLIGHNVVIRPGLIVGNDVMIGHGCCFEGHTLIENNITIHCQCHITSNMVIMRDTFLGPMVATGNTRNIVHGRQIELDLQGPVIGRGVRIGLGAVLTPGIVIYDNAFIGAGSVVTKNVLEAEMWLGNPAKYFKNVNENELYIYID